MSRKTAVVFAILALTLFPSCFEGDDDPVKPKDEDAPEAEILSPAGGERFPLGSTITFIGTGVDPQDGALHGSSLVWRVDHRDILGTGDTIETAALAEGLHTIKLTAIDSDGKSGSDGIFIEVIVEDLSLGSIWPNGDGSRWAFEYSCRWWDDDSGLRYWPTPEEVPDIPTMEEVEDLLRNQPPGEISETGEAAYSLEFAGDTTTWSGVTAQNLRVTFVPEGGDAAVSAGSRAGNAFLARLCAARPDLAGKIKARYPWIEVDAHEPQGGMSGAVPSSDPFEKTPKAPIFVHGYAWEKTEDWIGTYGDIDQDLAWKFLESNLQPGHEFSFQLVPALASDVYLHCKVLRTFTAQTRLGPFDDSIECLYEIDYGIFAVTNEMMEPLGYSRSFDYGSVVYSPGIGPVYSYERYMLMPGDQPTLGFGDLEIVLHEAIIR